MTTIPKKVMVKLSLRNLKIIIFFLFFYIFGWLLLTFRITDVPPGINGDEASIGYNAILVARTGHDQSGTFLPLFVSAFDLTDWKQPITFYSTVLAFKIFRPSYALLREVSVVFVLLSATFIFLLTREFLGFKESLISLFVFMTIPIVLIQSHLALENIAPVPFITLWLLFLCKYQKNPKNMRYLVFSAFSLGVSLFTYPGMRLIFPTLVILTTAFLFYLNHSQDGFKKFKPIVKFLFVVSIFPLFMLAIKNQYPGAILAYNRPQMVSTYQELILPYISSFDPSYLFIKGDSTPYHSTGKQGVFLLATLPIFALGLVRIIQKKDPRLIFIMLSFFMTPLLYGLTGSTHRGSRLLSLLPLFTIIATVGLITLFEIKKKLWSVSMMVFIIFLIFLNYSDFLFDYWCEYPNRVKSEFSKPYHLVFEKAFQLSKKEQLKPYIQHDFNFENKIATDFFEQIYFPNSLTRWQTNESLPKGSMLIANPKVIPDNQKSGLQRVDVGSEFFGIFIKR